MFAVPFLREDGAEDTDTPLDDDRRGTSATSPTASASTTSGWAATSTARTSRTSSATSPGCPALLDALRADGFTEDEVERIAWGNWRRVLGASWSA